MYQLAVGLHGKGHRVSIVAPQGSQLPQGIELIPTGLREPEEAVYGRYKERLEKGEFEVCHDASWEAWAYASSIGHDPELPILHTIHTAPQIYGTPPPLRFPCLVGLSESHTRAIRLHLRVDARRVYNGVDQDFYTIDPQVKRNGRYLFLGRYTAEKGPLQAIGIARRQNVGLDCVGDTEIVGAMDYVDRCRSLCDGVLVKFFGGVSRDETRKLYREHKALLFPLQWSEPYGLTVVESSLCGCPVLSLRRGAIPELVKDGENGFLYDTEEELEQAVRDNVAASIDPERARKAVERFTVQRMVDDYEKLYWDVVEGRRW